jgi:hypothetical protein
VSLEAGPATTIFEDLMLMKAVSLEARPATTIFDDIVNAMALQ